MRDREATALYGWRPYMHDPALAHWLHRITRPSLVLWGEEDGIVSASYGESLAAAIPGSRFELIANAGHMPHLERPSEFVDLVSLMPRIGRDPAERAARVARAAHAYSHASSGAVAGSGEEPERD